MFIWVASMTAQEKLFDTKGNTTIKTYLEKDLATTTINNRNSFQFYLWSHSFYYSIRTLMHFLKDVFPCYTSGLSTNDMWSHLHVLKPDSIYLAMLLSPIQNFIWPVNSTPMLQQVTVLGSHIAPCIMLYSRLGKNSQLGKIFFVTSTFLVYASNAFLRLKF